MINSNEIDEIAGRDVYGSDNDKIGRAGQVYLDDETGNPEWVTVNTGFFGTNESFVPLREASLTGDRVTVPYTKAHVKDAPNVDPDAGHLSPEEENELFGHYNLTQTSAAVAGGRGGPGEDLSDADRLRDPDARLETDTDVDIDTNTEGFDTSGPTTDEAMTRSEERLKVGTETRETGRARLRKYVVTEQQTVTVPVSREEVRVEREPITDATIGDATSGPEISEEEHEVVLHEERPVVEKETVPVERVRLATETVAGEETVTEEVRQERIETDGVEEDSDLDADTAGRRND